MARWVGREGVERENGITDRVKENGNKDIDERKWRFGHGERERKV